ncbi:MAG: AraC family transcriptional regulator [Bryobacteraceae bacterium]
MAWRSFPWQIRQISCSFVYPGGRRLARNGITKLMQSRQPSWTPADPFAEALHSFSMTGAFYCRSELREPWGLEMPPMAGCLWFHMLTEGRCQIESRSEFRRFKRVELRSGDFVLVPHGEGHVLSAGAAVSTPVVTELPHAMVGDRYALLRYGGKGPPATLICGIVKFDHPAAQDLVAILPHIIHLESSRLPHSGWMQNTLKLMAEEARALRPGGETIVTRLADVLVIQAIRAWLEQDAASLPGWLGALKDPHLGRAIIAIHRDPAIKWTVQSLAETASMSRAAFAARFVELVGETPMQYVTRLRMRLAGAMLAKENATVSEVAIRFGYESEAAFSRAFKRTAGVAPGSLKRSV